MVYLGKLSIGLEMFCGGEEFAKTDSEYTASFFTGGKKNSRKRFEKGCCLWF